MSEPRRCPQCDAEIPANSPAGLCPRCLLKASDDSQSAGPSEPGPTKLTPPNSSFEPPTVEELAPLFPQLEILELLGKGGMGAVYKARQPGLDRLVALKILPPEISRDPSFAERFQREARALARLNHPHIVAVYDFGTTEANGGRQPPGAGGSQIDQGADAPRSPSLCYILMEFVDGANLRQTIRAGKLAAAEALAIVPQICEALQFAHDEGIVHRDIKPENILIDKRGRVKIADFGLAKLMANGGRESPGASLTATHQVMGTLRYMAPEQMQGSREVDHRADIYSLGVVFYELLTGELPMGKFAPPSKKVQVDVRLDEIVLRALEQDPEQRYQHASEVKTDVDTINRTPSVARPESAKGVAPSPAEPHAFSGQTYFVVVLSVLALVGLAMWFGQSAWWLLALLVPEAMIAALTRPDELRTLGSRLRLLSVVLAILGLIAFGMWLEQSPWPLLALVIFSVPIVAASVKEEDETPENATTGTGPVSSPATESVARPESAKGAATETQLVQAPADCLLLAAGIAFVTACGVALWLGVSASLGRDISNLTNPMIRGNLTGMSVGLAIYSVFVALAGLMLRRLRVRLFVLLVAVIVGLFFPAVCALNVVMELRNIPVWPVAIPLWLGMPAALWVVVTLFRDDVRRAFDAADKQRAEKTGTDPVTLPRSPSDGPGDVAQRLAVARFLVRGPAIGMVAIGVAAWVQSIVIALCLMFLPLASWDGGVLSASPIVALLGIPYGAVLLLAGLQMKRLQAYTLAVLAGVLASGGPLGVVWLFAMPVAIWAHIVLWKPEVKDAFTLRLRERILAIGADTNQRQTEEVQDAKTTTSTVALPRPKLVPVLATFNLVGAIVLMLVCAMEEPAEFAKPMPRLWQVWEQVDAVLGFSMAAGMFAASIGLFLWKPWARKVTLGVCIYGLASLVFDAPYLARVALPDLYAEIQQTVIAEGVDPDAQDFVTLFTIVVLFGGMLVVGLTWLIGQVVYFNRPRVVAAFESPGEKHGKFIDWLCTGAGAMVGVLSVFAPLALLLGLAAFFDGSKEERAVDPSTDRLNSTQPQSDEVWFGNKGDEHVGPDSPTVSDRLASHLGLDPSQRAAMNQAFEMYFREFRALEERNTRHETDVNGHQITTIAAFPQPLTQLAERFWSGLESSLDGRQLTLGRKAVLLKAGVFASGDYGHRIEIWHVGQINPWFHWKESQPVLSTEPEFNAQPSSGPELPEKLRRFWKEPPREGDKDDKEAKQ